VAFSNGTSETKIFDSSGKSAATLMVGGKEQKGGWSAVGADVDGNRRDEIVVAPGVGQKSEIKVFNQEGTVLKTFLAYDKSFLGGVSVAIGDVNGDGQDEIVTAPRTAGGPHVRIFDGQGNVKGQFFAYDKSFRGGVSVAIGDVDGDGQDEIVTAVGFKGAPLVKVFDARGSLEGQFYAYDRNFMGGVNLAVADVVNESGRQQKEIVTAPAKNGGPHIRIFDAKGNVKGQFFAYDKSFRGGVSVAAGDVDGNGLDEVVTGAGVGGGPHVRIFKADGKMTGSFYAFGQSFNGGVSVGTVSVGN
jgi:hypothetical protein